VFLRCKINWCKIIFLSILFSSLGIAQSLRDSDEFLREYMKANRRPMDQIMIAIWQDTNSSRKKQVVQHLKNYLKKAKSQSSFEHNGPAGMGSPTKHHWILENGIKCVDKVSAGDEQPDANGRLDYEIASYEVPVYELDELWDLNVVPVTVEGKLDGNRAIFQVWVPNSETWQQAGGYERAKSDGRDALELLDYIVHNSDGNDNNRLIVRDRGFKKGDWLAGIDYGWAFHDESEWFNLHRNVPHPSEIEDESNASKFAEKISKTSESSIRAILKRGRVREEFIDKAVRRAKKVAKLFEPEKIAHENVARDLGKPARLEADEIEESIILNGRSYRVLDHYENGAHGTVFKLRDQRDRSLWALKIAKGDEEIEVVTRDEVARNKALLGSPQKPAKYRLRGKNFVLKTFYDGQRADEFMENFDPHSDHDQTALIKLIRKMRGFAASGIYLPLWNPQNIVLEKNSQDWVVFDTSNKMRTGLKPARVLEHYRYDLMAVWLPRIPQLNTLLDYFNSPLGRCAASLVK
jgi:hypothetical protein